MGWTDMASHVKTEGAAFVVGGSGGLGRAICTALAAQFKSVFFTYRTNLQAAEALAEQLAPECAVGFTRIDMMETASVQAAVDSAVERFGPLHAVVLASGQQIEQPFVSQITESEWLEVLQVELMGFTRLIGATLPMFREQNSGAYVSLSSVATASFPPGDAISAVPKAGIEMLSRALAKEEGRYGIRANCVAPGIINSGLGSALMKDLYTAEIWETQRKRVALRRFGTADDVAQVVAFLASDQSRYVTGQTIYADGGFRL